ncbi:hypothetical protein BJV78DRAFT_1272506 [Lactifluus subvellereus]|nr:hypothetical protein BJV78DRAFT_1272506 [Lactifluus subvellereus]
MVPPYEAASYYNGITTNGDHPVLVYRSDFVTTPFPEPNSNDRFFHLPVKSLHGVFDTPLNWVWHVVGPAIRDLVKARNIQYTSIDPARFLTHATLGEGDKGSLGPVVVWIVPQTLAGPPLLPPADSTDPTHYARRFLTALLAAPLTTEGMEEDDAQGTLTLWFLENKDDDGNASDKVYGLSNCHVLRKNTTVDYSHRGGAPKDHVRVCGMRRYQRGLDDITKAVADHAFFAHLHTQDILRLQASGEASAITLRRLQNKLDEENEAIALLEGLHDEATKHWSNVKLQRDIGHVAYTRKITVDVGRTRYTEDWGVFVADEAKVRAGFIGNVVDLGAKYSPLQLMEMFYPVAGGETTFKYPDDGKLRIYGCATREDLAVPAEFDSEGQRCLVVGKDGNTTDLTVGRYAGLESFTQNSVGVESIELAIYNSGNKANETFSAKGDSGSLVWHMRDGKAYMVGQLHSGHNKGGSTNNHVTYCTPAWWLLAQIKKKFPHAIFYPESWPQV